VHDSAASLVRWFTYNLQTGRIHTFWPWLLLLLIETLISAGFLASIAVLVVQAVRGWFNLYALLAPACVLLVGLNGLLIKLPYRRKKDMALVWWFLVPLLGHFVIGVAIWRSAFLKKMRLGREQIVEFNRDGSIKRILRKSSPAG
jgi:hypothetical protein